MNFKKHYAKQKKPDAEGYILYGIFRKGQALETESRAVLAWGWAWEQRLREKIFWSNGMIGKLESGDGCVTK